MVYFYFFFFCFLLRFFVFLFVFCFCAYVSTFLFAVVYSFVCIEFLLPHHLSGIRGCSLSRGVCTTCWHALAIELAEFLVHAAGIYFVVNRWHTYCLYLITTKTTTFRKNVFGSFCSFMGNIFWCISFFLCVPATLLLLFWGFKKFSLYFVDYSTPSPPLPCRYLPQTVVWSSGVVFSYSSNHVRYIVTVRYF